MLTRTHLALAFATALYFLPHVSNKLVFLLVLITSNLIPGIGQIFSMKKHNFIMPKLGKTLTSRFIRSYTFTIIVTILLALFLPILALPFFLGYSFHLYLDAFTPDGIRPFWPLKKELKGKIRRGGPTEMALFVVFLMLDVAFLINLFF